MGKVMIEYEETIDNLWFQLDNEKKSFAVMRKAFIKDYSKSKNELVRLMGKYTNEAFVPGEKFMDSFKKTVNTIAQLK